MRQTMAPDVNVLLAALREDHPHHDIARSWLLARLAAAASGEVLIILPMVAAGVLRVATHPKVFVPPTPPTVVLDFLEKIITAPGVEYGELGREWPTLRRFMRELAPRGNAIPDAWIAAAAQTLGVRLVAFDTDFRRYLSASEFTLLSGSSSK
jgi:toxin-antitoxin system PIN domain toxin